jgi:dTDP-4-dehydrorhamnose 3,5-epimerase
LVYTFLFRLTTVYILYPFAGQKIPLFINTPKMQFEESFIKGLYHITPRLFKDERGFFFESYNEEVFRKNGIEANFVQDNQSYSVKGVLRGLHFQKEPYAQGKLVRVITGKALDVVVDLRAGSPTFGKHETFLLEADKNNMVYVPPGFAHGFVTYEETIFFYKCTNLYNKESESGLLWNDPALGIDWGITNPIVSDKDQVLPQFDPSEEYFPAR